MSAVAPRPAAASAVPARRVPRPRARARSLAILHVITRLDRGGSSDCTLLQAMGAARRGHRVTLVSGPSAIPSPLLAAARTQPGLEILQIDFLVRRPSPLQDLRALGAIRRLVRDRRFDVVHTHTSKAGALGRLAAFLGGRPPLVHQPHGHLFYGYHGPIGTALVVLAERLLAPLASRQIALSWRGAEEHLCRGIGRPGDFTVVRSGIDLRPYRRARARRPECRRRWRFSPEDFVVGTLCRLEPVKGVAELLDAFLLAASSTPRLRLVVGGDGPLRGRLLERARDAGMAERVVVGGSWVRPEDVLPALDLFVLASRNEGMGRALIEAMAVGLPVVGTAVGGVPEVLEEGGAGILVPPGDPEALAAAISRLAADERLAAHYGRRARSRAVAFGAGRMNHALLKIYRKVIR
ncbi:MAG TPA: glycosyltransferase [Candidatus Polarisedimenticolia bacterium]|jgi:glycosyltransferase involved in cell wall biosynthesis|nr:glycosyltransferase [Candidatus Polarisedimenticolia bacterium]